MKHEAIYNLYSTVKAIVENENGTLNALDINEQIVSIDMSAVNAKALELQSIEEAKKQAKIDAKASALAKLQTLGLTEEEVKSIL